MVASEPRGGSALPASPPLFHQSLGKCCRACWCNLSQLRAEAGGACPWSGRTIGLPCRRPDLALDSPGACCWTARPAHRRKALRSSPAPRGGCLCVLSSRPFSSLGAKRLASAFYRADCLSVLRRHVLCFPECLRLRVGVRQPCAERWYEWLLPLPSVRTGGGTEVARDLLFLTTTLLVSSLRDIWRRPHGESWMKCHHVPAAGKLFSLLEDCAAAATY